MIPYLSRLSLSRWFGGRFLSGAVRRPMDRRVRLGVELLESRTMPSLITVTSASDDPSDTDSLRFALNNATPGETIDFAPNVRTVDLSNTLNSAGLTIGVNLSIVNDQGVGTVTIDGSGQFTVLTVPNSVTVSLSGLTIADGNTQGDGGGILNNGALSVSNCTFTSNSASRGDSVGGGILNNGTLMVSNSTFSNNSANGGGNGGGICNRSQLAISNCIFSNNSAAAGGAILNDGTLLTISGSTFSNSTADGNDGGAIYNDADPLTVTNSTFSANSTSGSGGAIYNVGTLTITNSTFSNNTADGNGGGICDIHNDNTDGLTVTNSTFANNSAGDGGGIYNSGELTVTNSTFSANFVSDPTGAGGGVYAGNNPSFVTLDSNIVCGNISTFSGTVPDDIAGLVGISSSDNLIGTGGSGGLTDGVNGNQIGVSVADVGLGPLGNNGGVTETFAIGSGSFAIGKGVTETTTTTDQRGVARPINQPSDVGAYQYSVALPVSNPASIVPFVGELQSATVASIFEPLEALVTDSSGNPVSGASVTFAAVVTANGTTGRFASNTSVTTNTRGVAIAPAFTAGQTAGSFTVTASVGNVASPAEFNLTNTPSVPATIIAVGGTPLNTPIGSAYSSYLQAKVVDEFGNPLANVPVTFAAPLSGPSGSFNALTTVPTNALGIATAPAFSANHVVGSFTITATSAGIGTPAIFTLTNTAIPAAIRTLAASGQHASVNSTFTTPLKVLVTDAAGKPVAGITVDFELPGSAANGMFAGSAAVVTDVNGVAAAALMANTVAGSFTVSAWVAGVKKPATFSLTNLPLGPSAVNFVAGSGQTAALGHAYAKTLQAKVVDQYGNPLKGVKVTFRAPTAGASGMFGGRTTATAVTGATGIATIAITANRTAGNFQVTASAAQVTTPATFSLTNSPIHAIKVVAGSPQNATINATYATAFWVEVVDAAGHPLQGISITFQVPGSGASGSFASSATVVTDVNGIAKAPVFTANNAAGRFSVSASLTVVVDGVPSAIFQLDNKAL